MSYKNDHLLTISNKFGKASSDAKAELFETYDKLRDLTVSGSGLGAGATPAASFLINLSRLIAPSSFMPILGNQSINIPGTSYHSPISGGNSILPGGNSAFGFGQLGKYPAFPTGNAAPLIEGIGGMPTGYAASMVANSASYVAGASSGYGFGNNIVLPLAGLISGVGGVLQSVSPYLSPAMGAGTLFAANLLQGTGNATLGAYQKVSGQILNNADTILANRVKNIETVVKMLNTQSDIVKKMLKNSIEGDSKAIQDL